MDKKISVLMVGYEAAPFFKRGGLGDVMASLPKALSRDKNIDIRIVIPHYHAIQNEFFNKEENSSLAREKRIGQFGVHFGKGIEEVGVYTAYIPGTAIITYFLSNRPNLSYINTRGRNKKIDQFAFFDLAVSHFISWLSKNESWKVSLVHCNDWQTSLIPFILKKKLNLNLPTLLTIHNLNYQGKGSFRVLDLLHIREEDTKELKKGKPVTEINILGEGIMHATRVSTVSPTYAKEMYEDYSRNKIYHFLNKRERELGKKDQALGILNGIDYDSWNPEVDKYIYHKFNVKNLEEGKKNNKEDLLKTLSLADLPTFCFIGRMAWQKGIDILIKAVKRMKASGFNLIFLGSGTPIIEKSAAALEKLYPSNIRAIVSYNEEMAHKIYAGSDFIIIPSRYEPCGLIQMVAMKYGTIPIASNTGGLKDSISNGKDGLLFAKGRSVSLKKAIKHALNIKKDIYRYKKMAERAMRKDFSWDKSAVLYKKLYEEMIKSS